MEAKEIRVPLEFVREGDDVALLLTSEERAALQGAIKAAEAEQDIEGAREAAEVWRDALATDASLRKQMNAHIWTAVFRKPTWRDKADIEAQARVYRPELDRMVLMPDMEYPLRVEKLLVRVEEEDGSVAGGIEVIPDQAVAHLGAQLDRHFHLQGDLKRFLSISAKGQAKAKK